MENTFPQEDIFVQSTEVAKAGAIAGAALTGVVLVMMFAVLQNSSRLPRIIATYALLGGIGCFLAGGGLVSDIDRLADKKPRVVQTRVVTMLNRIDRHSSKGPKYRYQGCFSQPMTDSSTFYESSIVLPNCMNLSAAQFSLLKVDEPAQFTIGRGALGFPWYEAVQPVPPVPGS